MDKSSTEVMEQYLIKEKNNRAVIIISHQVGHEIFANSQNVIRLKRERT